MIKYKITSFYLSVIVISIIITGCRFDKDKILQLPRTNHHDILPIAFGKVTPLDSLEKQDSNIVRNMDGSFKYVLKQDISEVKFDTLVDIPTVNLTYSSKMPKFILADITTSTSTSLDQMLEKGNSTVRDSLRAHNGENYPFPAFSLPEGTADDQLITFGDIKYVTLDAGTATFTLTNGLPVPILPYTIKLINQIDNSVFIDITKNINPGETITEIVDLKDRTINQILIVRIAAEMPGSGGTPVPIDTGAKVRMDVAFSGLEARSGLAKIPNSDINKLKVDQKFNIDIENGIILNQITFLSGDLKIKENSYLKVPLNLKLTLPSITNAGNPLSLDLNIPKANGSTPGVDEKTVDLIPYTFTLDLDSISNIFKVVPVTITGDFVPDAEGYVEFDVPSDSLVAIITMENIKFNKVTGFFGNKIENIENITPVLDSTSELIGTIRKVFGESGYIALDSVFMKIVLENSLGVSGGADLDFTSYNALNNNTVNVKDSKTLVSANDLGNAPETVISTFILDPKSMAQLVSNIPKTIVSKIKIEINKDVPADRNANFIYSTSKIKGVFEIEVPLSLVANDLAYGDTVETSVGYPLDKIIEYFTSGNLKLTINNTFPFKLDIGLAFLDSTYTKLQDLVLVPNTIDAGVSTTNKVTIPTKSVINIPVSLDLLKNLQKTKFIFFKATINSGSKISGMKLYSDYFVDFKIIADLKFSTDK